MKSRFSLLLLIMATLGDHVAAGGSPLHFERNIQPIFEANCMACHGSQTHQSGLVLETVVSILKGGALEGPAIVAACRVQCCSLELPQYGRDRLCGRQYGDDCTASR